METNGKIQKVQSEYPPTSAVARHAASARGISPQAALPDPARLSHHVSSGRWRVEKLMTTPDLGPCPPSPQDCDGPLWCQLGSEGADFKTLPGNPSISGSRWLEKFYLDSCISRDQGLFQNFFLKLELRLDRSSFVHQQYHDEGTM
ncbi:unnamed protein product [Merluccius merluccius]